MGELIPENQLHDELVNSKIKWIEEHRDYLIEIETKELKTYEVPTKISMTFTFLKPQDEKAYG